MPDYQSGLLGPTGGYLLAIAVILGWIASVCLHEFGHAIVAYWGGDTTVKDKGYLTLNPLKYTDIGYSLALPVVFLVLGGVALPGAAVYINQTLLRSRGWNSAVSAAGPFMTGLVAIALALPFRLGWATEDHWFWYALALLASYQVAALCFNLFPVPSFDGFGILEPWLPQPVQQRVRRWGRYGYWVLFAILWTVPAANRGFWALVNGMSQVLGIPYDKVSFAYAAFAQPSKVIFIALLFIALIFRKALGGTFNKPTENDDLNMNLAAYDRLIQSGRGTSNIWKYKGDTLLSLKQYEGAIASYDEALKTQPTDPDLWHNRAFCLHSLEQYDQALIAYDQALKYEPENSTMWTNKANVLECLKCPKEAVAAYDQSLKYAPSELENWFRRGQLLSYELQDYSAALSDLERVLKYQPNHLEGRLRYAITLEELGQIDKALKEYQQVLRYDQKNIYAWQGTWRSLNILKRDEEALKILKKALKIFPVDAELWTYRGTSLEKAGKFDDAIKSYDNAIQYNVTHSGSWTRKIDLLEQQNCKEEALEVLEKAQELFPKELEFWFSKGRIYFYRQEYELAISAFEHCIQGKHVEATAHFNKACCYALQKKPDLAIQSLKEILNYGESSLLEEACNDPDLESLYDLEAFQQLVTQSKASE